MARCRPRPYDGAVNASEEWGHGYQARIILDSVNPAGCRLVTWVLKYPRFIHAELLTHRQFSRNSSSSRARPISAMIAEVAHDPVIPVHWGKNQSGMQAQAELDQATRDACRAEWLAARDRAIDATKRLADLGLHKQVANRVLEPWMWITVVLSTTTHANFFALRDHPDAQPEIATLARAMRRALDASTPEPVAAGDWHLPFLTPDERSLPLATRQAASTARCARVSYLTHDGAKDLAKDLALHERLRTSQPPHASAFEHGARATADREHHANFVGWIQYRHHLPHESAPHEFVAP